MNAIECASLVCVQGLNDFACFSAGFSKQACQSTCMHVAPAGETGHPLGPLINTRMASRSATARISSGLLIAHWAACHRQAHGHGPLSQPLQAAAAAATALLTEPAVAGSILGVAQPFGLAYTELELQYEQLHALAHALLRHYASSGWDVTVRCAQ